MPDCEQCGAALDRRLEQSGENGEPSTTEHYRCPGCGAGGFRVVDEAGDVLRGGGPAFGRVPRRARVSEADDGSLLIADGGQLVDHPAVADVGHLLRGEGKTSRKALHLPAEDDPDRPACRCGEHDGHWWRVDPDRAPENYRLCRYCDPDHEIDRSGHSAGNALRAKLLAMDPDELGRGSA